MGLTTAHCHSAREPQKSFGHQQTFSSDLTDEDYAEATLRRMADDLFAQVREEGRSVRTLTVKVRYNDMGEDQCSESLAEPTDLETEVYGRIHNMLRAAWKRRVSLRLVSLKLSNVYDGRFRSELALEVFGTTLLMPASGWRLRWMDSAKHAGTPSFCAPMIFVCGRRRVRGVAGEPARIVQQVNYRRKAPPAHVGTYVPLRAHSHYSFLDSTLSPAAIVELAKQHGLPAVAMTDTGNLHGAVEFVLAAKQAGIKPVLGVELCIATSRLLLYVRIPTWLWQFEPVAFDEGRRRRAEG